MSIIKRLYIWILVSIIIQVSLLGYVNNVFLNTNDSIINKIVQPKKVIKNEIENISIPIGSSNLKISYDGSYIAYNINNGMLEVSEVGGDRQKKIINSITSSEVSYFKWLPDRNMIIYAQTINDTKKSDKSSIRLITYSMDNNKEMEYPDIVKMPRSSKVTDIELSTLTNVVYCKIDTGNSINKIYKFNIMNDINYVMSLNKTNTIKELNLTDFIIYEEDDNLFLYDGNRESTIPVQMENYKILGVDSNDKIYIVNYNNEGDIIDLKYGNIKKELLKDRDIKTVVPKNSYEKTPRPTATRNQNYSTKRPNPTKSPIQTPESTNNEVKVTKEPEIIEQTIKPTKPQNTIAPENTGRFVSPSIIPKYSPEIKNAPIISKNSIIDWKNFNLNYQCKIQDVKLTNLGDIVLIDQNVNKVHFNNKDKWIGYDGVLLDVNDSCIISNFNGKLIIKNLQNTK